MPSERARRRSGRGRPARARDPRPRCRRRARTRRYAAAHAAPGIRAPAGRRHELRRVDDPGALGIEDEQIGVGAGLDPALSRPQAEPPRGALADEPGDRARAERVVDQRHDQLEPGGAGGEREDVRAALALERPADVVGGDDVDPAQAERAGPQRRVDLRLAAATGELRLVEQEVVRAALGADIDALRAGREHERHPARRREMADVEPHAGLMRELEAARDGLVLGDRRSRARVSEGVAAVAGGALGVDPGADDVIVLGVHAGKAAGRRDPRECRQQLAVGDPREALGVRLEGRQLERRGAGLDERGDVLDRAARRHRRPQRDVDAGLALDRGGLGRERLRRLDRAVGVIGHVDDRRDAAGGGGGRAAIDALLRRAAGVDVDVDRARQHEGVAEIEHAITRQASASLADGRDPALVDRRHAPARGHPGQHEPSCDLLDR